MCSIEKEKRPDSDANLKPSIMLYICLNKIKS